MSGRRPCNGAKRVPVVHVWLGAERNGGVEVYGFAVKIFVIRENVIMKKKMLMMILCMATVFVCQPMLHVSASVASLMEEEKTAASYDMAVGGTQTFELTDEEGEEVIVTVSELPSIGRVANGAYQISYTSTGCWEAGYKITVSNNKIISAYDKYYKVYSGSISSDKLKVDSSTQASYRFEYERFWHSTTRGVSSTLNGNKIDVLLI